MKKIIIIILTMFFLVNVKAYDNNFFSIEVPDNFNAEEKGNGIINWVNKDNSHENIIITVLNNAKNENIDEYTDENMNEYKTYLKEKLDKELEAYNVSVEVSDVKKETINEQNSLSYNIYWPTKEIIGYDIYQKGYVFTKKNYIYTYTFTSDNKIEDNEAYISSINSFRIKDVDISNKSFRIKIVLLVGIVGGIISALVKVIKKRNSK
jgi:hypothetical protein